MNITLYRGARGNGKTLTMVKDGYKYLKKGWPVYTNLSKTPFKEVSADFIINLDGDSMLKNCVLLIDEIEFFFDSREWNKSESKNFGRFLQQIRKRNVVILCTAQYSNLIDIRLRQQIDCVVICAFDFPFATGNYIDLTSFESSPNKPLSFKIKYYAPPIFKLYDTFQLI
eukprot:GHVR01187238.1.p1 GENE.GHVR01187238.1~~GHVR01187238.1.p1  ORF type:complete len:170 (-),score=3.04 GHVR01187238.1:145-654(-)